MKIKVTKSTRQNRETGTDAIDNLIGQVFEVIEHLKEENCFVVHSEFFGGRIQIAGDECEILPQWELSCVKPANNKNGDIWACIKTNNGFSFDIMFPPCVSEEKCEEIARLIVEKASPFA